MIIRIPSSVEIPKIVSLLQESLGDSLVKKSITVWNFKHINNPFGRSYVLVGEEENDLIGVRAFMQWKWQIRDDVYVSYRAVDTATHPKHQGKGIFKKLTIQALEDVRKLGKSFVFNTPNEKSRPGYIKMGWQEVGKIDLSLIPSFFYFFRLIGIKQKFDNKITNGQLDLICKKHNSDLVGNDVFFTPKSSSYLKWRYEENPMQKYIVVSTQGFYIAMYAKKHKFFNEMRVVEVIGHNANSNKTIQKAITYFAFKNKCILISIANKKIFRFSFFGNYGPMLTFRPLDIPEEIKQKALEMKYWSYSLGDLELF